MTDTIQTPSPAAETFQPRQGALDDVYGSEDETFTSAGPAQSPSNHVPVEPHSDIARLRSAHVTNGYREGISVGKTAETVQSGFDEGYALGAEIGLVAGRLLGVVSGLVAATSPAPHDLLDEATKDLALLSLFSREWFDETGLWKYAVPGEDDEVLFRQVAAAHPLVQKWRARVESALTEHGVAIALDAAPGSGVTTHSS